MPHWNASPMRERQRFVRSPAAKFTSSKLYPSSIGGSKFCGGCARKQRATTEGKATEAICLRIPKPSGFGGGFGGRLREHAHPW